MKDAYTKLMARQHTTQDGDAVFFEKLEKAGRKPWAVWKIAVAVACILLLVPVTVWAAESIFGFTRITIGEGKDWKGKDAVVFHRDIENVEHIPIEEFSVYLQELKQSEMPLLASWEAAEEEMGIDFLSNTVLEDAGTQPYAGKNPKKTPFEAVYYVFDEQLFAVSFTAEYYRSRVRFQVTAKATTDHPLMTEEYFTVYHGYGEWYFQETDKITVEQFVTKNGIPATIFYEDPNNPFGWIHPCASFSVNNISYHIQFSQFGREGDETDEETNARLLALMHEILDGFVVE